MREAVSKRVVAQKNWFLLAFVFIKEVASFFSCVAGRLFFPLFFHPRRMEGGDRVTLLVHGYYDRASSLRKLQKKIAKAKMGPVYAFDFRSPYESIEQIASALEEKIETVLHREKKTDLFLVGHSMGGLVCSAYALLRNPNRVKKLVTIGSPLQGTTLAKLSRDHTGRQMLPDSSFLQMLKEKARCTFSFPVLHIGSDLDDMIFPFDSALGYGNHTQNQCLIPNLGHTSLLFSSRVIHRVIEFLA